MASGQEEGDASLSSLPSPSSSLGQYLVALQTSLVEATRHASQLPGPSDFQFHRSIDKKVAKQTDATASQVRDMIKQMSDWSAKQRKASSKDQDDDEEADAADINGKGFARISDIVDGLLEKSDICMDEYSGKVAPRRLGEQNASTSAIPTGPRNGAGEASARPGKLPQELLNAQMDPPQRKFTLKADNRVGIPWDRTLLLGKPNAQVPITWQPPPPGPGEEIFVPGSTRPGMYCAEGDPRENPYYYEIFNSNPPSYVYQPPSEEEMTAPPPLDAKAPDGISGVPFTWIDDKEGIEKLAAHLQEERVKEIAIDLEAHAYRTYQGLACLLQLSTRWGDYILDLLSDAVRMSAEKLNVAFTDPNKIKILHGAEHDVLWLQRDCGLYLVNLFDTYHATNVLNFPGHGLAFLLSKYYDFEADKRYQLADWRIRPLPEEMLYYARSDTHALIYIYHRLRDHILSTGGKIAMDEVFNRSKITAGRRYAKDVWDEEGNSREGWRTMWSRMGGEEARGTGLRMKTEQLGKTERLVRRLHQWRDQVAREEDESPKYILSAMNLINLASRAPMTKSEAMAVFTPGIPPVRKRAGEVARIVKEEILAWEQDQKRLQDQQTKALQASLVGTADAGGEEDLGSIAVASDAVMEEPPKATSTTQSDDQTSDANIWSTPRPALQSKRSSLFGSIADSKAVPPASPSALQSSLFSTLRTVVGSTSSLFGKPVETTPADEETAAVPAKAENMSSAIEASSSLRQDTEGSWLPAGGAKSDPIAETASKEAPISSSSSSSSSSDSETGPVVQVKKKKTKPRWPKEKKRTASAIASAGDEASESAATSSSNKKAKTDDTPITPFDYSSTLSVLDAPPKPEASSSNKKARKGKRDRKAERENTGPDRFADARQPRDRTEIKGVGKTMTFQ